MRTRCEHKCVHGRARAGHLSSSDPFDLRGFRARDDPPAPALRRVRIRGLAGTREHGRRLSSHRDTFGETVTPSLEERGSISGMDAEAFVAPLVVHLRLEALFAAAFSNGP